MDTKDHPFLWVKQNERNGEIILYGKLSHKHVFSEYDSHVDVAVIRDNGVVTYKSSAPVGNERIRGRYRDAWFEIRIPKKEVGDAPVHVAYHFLPAVGSTEPVCDNNQAVVKSDEKRR
jgi:hypothetical protein